MKTRNELLERSVKGTRETSAAGANRSKETREFQNKEQTARKELENFRTRLERN